MGDFWKAIAAIFILIFLLGLVGKIENSVPSSIPNSEPPVGECWEDEPCWDCETMGNLICGGIKT